MCACGERGGVDSSLLRAGRKRSGGHSLLRVQMELTAANVSRRTESTRMYMCAQNVESIETETAHFVLNFYVLLEAMHTFVQCKVIRLHEFQTEESGIGLTFLMSVETGTKTHKRLKERFLIGRNRTKRANFRGSPLFQATYDMKTEKQTIN